MKKKKEVKVPKSRQLLSMAIELAAQSERLVLLNEVGCVDDVIQAAERLCVKLGNLIAFAKNIQRGAKQHDFEGMQKQLAVWMAAQAVNLFCIVKRDCVSRMTRDGAAHGQAFAHTAGISRCLLRTNCRSSAAAAISVVCHL